MAVRDGALTASEGGTDDADTTSSTAVTGSDQRTAHKGHRFRHLRWSTGRYLVTQASLSAGRTTDEIVAEAIESGVGVVQLREKNRTARERYELGQKLRD